MIFFYRSHALRGNSSLDALRPRTSVARGRDAERHWRRSHAERGNDPFSVAPTLYHLIVPMLCVGTHFWTLCVRALPQHGA